MSGIRSINSQTKPSELQSAEHELQQEVILLALPGLYIAGIVLILLAGIFRTSLQGAVPGLTMLAVAGGVWYVRKLNYLLAAWLLVSGVSAATILLLYWAGLPTALGLFALPIGLITLLVGPVAAVATGVAASATILSS